VGSGVAFGTGAMVSDLVRKLLKLVLQVIRNQKF